MGWKIGWMGYSSCYPEINFRDVKEEGGLSYVILES